MMIRTVQHENAITSSDTGQSPAWWGMMLMILTEAALFASLLLAYFYERSNSPAWPPSGIKEPELLLPSIMTALLLGSSATMVMAEIGIKRGREAVLRLGLVLSIVLAAAFLAVQVVRVPAQRRSRLATTCTAPPSTPSQGFTAFTS